MRIRVAKGLGLAVASWTALLIGPFARAACLIEESVSPSAEPPAAPRFQPLPAKAVGVVVSHAREVLRREGRFGPADAVCFARGEASYRWFYVPARSGEPGESLVFGVGQGGDETHRFDNLVMATPQTLRPWGIRTPYALVELTVNGGRGSTAEESFAATEIKTLDGTKDYPIQVDKAIGQLAERYKVDLRARKDIDEALSKARSQALSNRKPTGPREQTDHLRVTWLPEPGRERLRVEFRTEIRDGEYRYAQGVEPIGEQNPRSEVPPPEKQSPRAQEIRYGISFGVVTGAVYEVSCEGVIGPGRFRKPGGFVQILPPPAGAVKEGAGPSPPP